MKKSIMIWLTALCVGLLAGSAWACPYFTTYNTGNIKFTYTGSTVNVSIDPTKINNTSYGTTDPLVGKYQTIYAPAHSSYDFSITRSEPGSSIFTASSDPLVLRAQSSSSGGTKYLQGNLTAIQIDFTTGVITWSTVTNLQVLPNTLGSATLNEFSSYNVGTLQFTFDTTGVLSWLDNPSGYIKRTYSSTLTGGAVSSVPEPGEWLLLIIGLAAMGYVARRRLPAAEMNVRPAS